MNDRDPELRMIVEGPDRMQFTPSPRECAECGKLPPKHRASCSRPRPSPVSPGGINPGQPPSSLGNLSMAGMMKRSLAARLEPCGLLSPDGFPNPRSPCSLPRGHGGAHVAQDPSGTVLAQSTPPPVTTEHKGPPLPEGSVVISREQAAGVKEMHAALMRLLGTTASARPSNREMSEAVSDASASLMSARSLGLDRVGLPAPKLIQSEPREWPPENLTPVVKMSRTEANAAYGRDSEGKECQCSCCVYTRKTLTHSGELER